MHRYAEKIVTFLPPGQLESSALQQIENTAKLPFVYPHVAVMPDAHHGKGSTVGTVLPTKGAIIPASVGVDIGCGMIAVRTNVDFASVKDKLREIRLGVERRIPMSAGKFNKKIMPSATPRIAEMEATPGAATADSLSRNWRHQLGTLGGGNHFIELCLDTESVVWATLHSGSRGVGNRIGNTYIRKAQDQLDATGITLPDRDLAYLSEGTEDFDGYLRDLRWAQKFALLNREEMMDRFMAELAAAALGDHTKGPHLEIERINSHHNFTQIEEHFGENIWVTRKGAIEADIGKQAMIPGSMGTRSYIVTGKAHPMSLNSAPHGAGRRFSRGEARRRFTMADFDKAMQGIEHRRTDTLLDEIPGAYKDIDEVMEHAKELVEVVATLKQVLNIKGD